MTGDGRERLGQLEGQQERRERRGRRRYDGGAPAANNAEQLGRG
jgi:hypothetical protein